MTLQVPLAEAISERLEQLRARVKSSLPTIICETGSLDLDASLELYASFLKEPTAETIDLVVVIEPAGEGHLITADVVQGGTGVVLSETREKLSPRTLPAATRRILKYLDNQGPTIVQALQVGDTPHGE